MILQKSAEYESREYVGIMEEGNLYKRIFAFMIVGLKQSITFIVQAIQKSRLAGFGCLRNLMITLTIS